MQQIANALNATLSEAEQYHERLVTELRNLTGCVRGRCSGIDAPALGEANLLAAMLLAEIDAANGEPGDVRPDTTAAKAPQREHS
jgi:hypothetical protein